MIGWRPILVTVLIVVVGLAACVVRTNHRAHPVYVVPRHEKHEKHKDHHDNGRHRGDKHGDHDDD